MLQLFPSRQIAWYMAKLFLTRVFAVLIMLVLILQALDLLGESGKILAVPANDQGDILHYISMRIPQLVARFLPYAVLLATLITFSGLSQNSEVISMKAAGLSAHQILAPMILSTLAIAGGHFLFNDMVVAPGTAKLKQWQAVKYGPIPTDSGTKANVWVREGQDLINAGTVTGTGNATLLSDVAVYLRANNGLRQVIRAPSGRYVNGAWQLQNAQLFNVATVTTHQYASINIGKGIAPSRFQAVKVDGDSRPFFPLMRDIAEMKTSGKRTANLEAILWHKISGPLSAVLMPLLGAVAAFGLARSGTLFVRAAIGMALGFTYFVADNFALAMGNLGAYPPLLAAWAPFFLFLLIGETVLIRTEE
jgi:lipopolysaccharide export system permease protein